MPIEIARVKDGPTQSVTFTASNSTTGGFNFSLYAGAMIHVSSVTGSPTTLTWKVKENEEASTVYPVADGSDAAITTTIQTGRAYPLPDELFAAGYVMATTDTGTAVCKIIVKG